MQPKYKIAICAPCHIQPSEEWVQALKSVSNKSNVKVIIVDDSNGKIEMPDDFEVFDYDRQEEFLGEELYAKFEKFHKSSACKNFGHLYAYKKGFDIIIGLDSDCIVPPNFIADHLEGLMMKSTGWVNTIKNSGWFPRGFPFSQRNLRTAFSLGLWENELDLYGTDRAQRLPELPPPSPCAVLAHEVADGMTALSGMNWACWAECIPALLFLPNFEYRPDIEEAKLYKFRRHDDIWGGYIFQALMAKRDERLVFGHPIVFHDTVVVAEEDAAEEEDAIAFENSFYNAVDVLMTEVEFGDYDEMFYDFYKKAEVAWANSEWQPLVDAMEFWVNAI